LAKPGSIPESLDTEHVSFALTGQAGDHCHSHDNPNAGGDGPLLSTRLGQAMVVETIYDDVIGWNCWLKTGDL